MFGSDGDGGGAGGSTEAHWLVEQRYESKPTQAPALTVRPSAPRPADASQQPALYSETGIEGAEPLRKNHGLAGEPVEVHPAGVAALLVTLPQHSVTSAVA